nr:NUDIX domain protein [uncultured bacterium]
MAEITPEQEIKGTLKIVGLLLFRNNFEEVLLVRHSKNSKNKDGIWGLPAGKIEMGKSPREAACDELVEETGLITKEGNLHHYEGNTFGADLQRHYNDETVVRHGRMDVLYCDNFEGELKGDEKTQPEWKKVSEVEGLETLPNVPLAIENFLNSKIHDS